MTNSQLRKSINRSLRRCGFLLISLVFGCFASGFSSVAIAQETIAQDTIAPETPDVTIRLEANLQPIIPVDVSGEARLDNSPGVVNDHFTAEVEIAKDDFAALGITPRNGFQDEVVVLRVLRNGVQVFHQRLQFSLNLLNDITFETDIRGAGAPELHAGDVVRVIVNGHFTLRGRFVVH